MISKMKTTLEELQSRLEANPNLSPEERSDLLELVQELHVEAKDWAEHEKAEEIRKFLKEVATPGENHPSFQERILQFEAEHPTASALIGRLADMLSRMGV